MLWDCKKCGTQAIADSLDDCPVCTTPNPVSREERTEEDRNPDRAAAIAKAHAQDDEGQSDVTAGQGVDNGPEEPLQSPETFPAGEIAGAPPSHELHDEEVPDGADN